MEDERNVSDGPHQTIADAMINALRTHICVCDLDGTIVTVNEAWIRFAEENGADPNLVSQGVNYLSVCEAAQGDGAEEGAAFASGIRAVARGERDEFVLEYACHSSGLKRWFTGRVTRMNWMSTPRIVIAHENITERKLAEDALHKSKFLLSEAERLAHTGAWDVDLITNIGTFSQGWVDMHGVPSKELPADVMMSLVHPDDAHIVEKAFERALSGSGGYEVQMRIRRMDTGEERIVHAVGELFSDESGRWIRAIGVSIDITDVKRVERERQAYLRQLRALSESLQTAREDERAWIAREIHDEFGQMLTGLAIDMSLLKKQLVQAGLPQSAQCQVMEEMIQRLIVTVQQISTELRPALLDEFGLIEAMRWLLKDFEKRSSIECAVTIVEDIPELDAAKATAIFRILQEALTNILRHADATKVSVRFYASGQHLKLEIEDNGTGMDDRRANDASSIGIVGMKERARVCGGSLRIASEAGLSTQITVRIPISGKKPAGRQKEQKG